MLHGSGCRTASHFELFRRLLPGGPSGSGRGRMRGPVRPTRALRAAIAILSSLATVATALVATAAAVLPPTTAPDASSEGWVADAWQSEGAPLAPLDPQPVSESRVRRSPPPSWLPISPQPVA